MSETFPGAQLPEEDVPDDGVLEKLINCVRTQSQTIDLLQQQIVSLNDRIILLEESSETST